MPIMRVAFYHIGNPDWLDNFTRQMPNLRQFHFRVCPYKLWRQNNTGLASCLEEYLPSLTELQVLSWGDVTYAARPLGTWTKEGGKQRHEDAIAKHEARHRKIGKILKQERSGV